MEKAPGVKPRAFKMGSYKPGSVLVPYVLGAVH